MSGFRKPAFKVEINGVDYTSRFNALVLSIEVTDKAGTVSDTANIKLADPDGSILMPQGGDDLKVSLGHDQGGVGQVFEGKVDKVRSTGTKGGGRQLTIGAKGFDAKGKAKEKQHKHKDKAKFGEVAKEWAKDAGIENVSISQSLSDIEDDYWDMRGESFLAWGQRVARENGATFKIQGGRAVFVEANANKTTGGKDIPPIEISFSSGDLLKWDISPVQDRAKHEKVKVEYYDPKTAKLKSKEVSLDDNDGKAIHKQTRRVVDEKTAERQSKSGKKRAERNAGDGSVTIMGDAQVKPEGKLVLSGCREGIDGEYLIDGVKHSYTRKGYTCDVDLKKPGGKAGKDSRKKPSSSSNGLINSNGPSGDTAF